MILTARTAYPDTAGNNITLATSLNPTTATLTLTTSGANLAGGSDASLLAPYELVRITGRRHESGQILVPGRRPEQPAAGTASEPAAADRNWPASSSTWTALRCPLVVVAPTYVVAQLPIELSYALEPDTTPPSPTSTINVTDTLRFPRTGSAHPAGANPDGTVQVSTGRGAPGDPAEPDAVLRPDPGSRIRAWPITSRASATATVSVDGTITGGDRRDRDHP